MSDAEIDALARRLRPHYQHFLKGKEDLVLLTGHSHQAWPDVCRQAQLQAFDDAAQLVDEKWSKIFGEILPDFQRRVAARLGSQRASDLAIAPNTHELGYRLHSCFPGAKAVVTSDGEFHSLRRQLGRGRAQRGDDACAAGMAAPVCGVTGKIALICPVPDAPKYGVTTSARPS